MRILLLLSLLFSCHTSQASEERSCSGGFEPRSLIGQDPLDVIGNPCLESYSDHWAVNPPDSLSDIPVYHVSAQQFRGRAVIILSLHQWKDGKKLISKVTDVLETELAGPGEQHNSIGVLGCWEKGRDIYMNGNSTIALGLAKLNRGADSELLRMWRVDKKTHKLYEASIDRAQCSSEKFEKSREMFEQLQAAKPLI